MNKYIYLFVLASCMVYCGWSQNTSSKMEDFIGINTNVAAYDQKYIGDLSLCVKWIREYHSWAHYEVADNYYRWDNITKHPYTYTWPDHNKFMDECKKYGINVLIDALNKPAWAGSARGAYSTGDGSKPEDYLDKLEFMGQLVARYGAQKIDVSKLETVDKVSGLNYIKYYEDDNEPDYWWETPLWPAEKYAVYCNAVHDGFGVVPSPEYPLLGIKSVDSTAMHVLGGLAENSQLYLQKILTASKGRIPFDVINIHTYCSDHKDGYSPESETNGIEKKLGGFMSWRRSSLPQIPVWITEFGWDTYISGTTKSYIYAPHQQQANYILRAYFVCLKMGFEKAFLFMDKDPNSTNTLQYSSSGIITDQASGLSKKPSFYYLATLQKMLGSARLKSIPAYREAAGNNEVYCFEFVNPSEEKIFAVWTREKNSKTDNGISMNYQLDLGYTPEKVEVITPTDKDLDGEKMLISTSGSKVNLVLTETPQFVVVAGNKTSLHTLKKTDVQISVFPNPVTRQSQISIYNPFAQKLRITINAVDGSASQILEDRFFEAGNHRLSFPGNFFPGVKMLNVSTAAYSKSFKIIMN